MKFVEPIREKNKISDIRAYLLKTNKRDWFLFSLGISTGLRISDLRVLKVADVLGRTHIILNEQKTGKRKQVPLNSETKKMIDSYTKKMGMDDYLFPSRQGNKPIGRNQAGNIISKAGEVVGLKSLGTHSLRKTFGYHHYQQFKDIAILMTIFNHSSQAVTMRYLGIEQDEIDKSYNSFLLI